MDTADTSLDLPSIFHLTKLLLLLLGLRRLAEEEREELELLRLDFFFFLRSALRLRLFLPFFFFDFFLEVLESSSSLFKAFTISANFFNSKESEASAGPKLGAGPT
jgi:hypothetical protein